MRAALRVDRSASAEAGIWLLAVLTLIAASIIAVSLLPDGVHFPRPRWLLHPDETGYLITARNLAETGSFVIEDEWYSQSPTHVPPGATEVDGRLIPRKAVGGYLVYATAFLISDGAWLYVGPFFGVLAALAAGVLVYQRTRELAGAAAAVVILGTSSPFIAYATGLAFADIIVVACILWSCVFFYKHLEEPTILTGFATGALAGFAVLTRLDFLVVAGLMGIVAMIQFWNQGRLRSSLLVSGPAIAVFLAVIAGTLVANDAFYGSPFKTGYQGGWQESPEGVASSFTSVSTAGLLKLSGDYLLRIGLPPTLLLIVGLVSKTFFERRAPAPAVALDFVFLGSVVFALVYFLGRPGAYGTGESWLVSSYPRYILHVYAIGVIWGVQAICLISRSCGISRQLAVALVLSVTVIAASVGVREAFHSDKGVQYIEMLTGRHQAIAATVAELGESPIVISDLNSKPILNARTITPLQGVDDSYDVVAEVISLLESGETVFVIGDQRNHPLYTGYVEKLQSGGVQLQRLPCRMELYQAFRREDALPPLAQACFEDESR